MRLPASYAGARRAPGGPVVLTAPYAKAQVHKPQAQGLRRRQRIAISIGANGDTSSDGGLTSDDSLSSGDESDSDSGAEGAITGSVRVEASVGLAASTARLPLHVGTSGARRSKRSGPQLSKAAIERRCNCKQHAHAQPAANAAVDGTVLVKIEDGKDAEEGDDEEEEEEEEEDEEEDEDDSSSSSSDSSSDEDDEEEEEDEGEDKDDKDIIVPILPAAAARIKRRAVQGRHTRRIRSLSPRANAASAASSGDEGVPSASDGESSQSSEDGVSSSDDEGAQPAAPTVSASVGVKVALPSSKIDVVGTIDLEASSSKIIPRSLQDEAHAQFPRLADMTAFAHGASPCIVAASSVFLLGVLALFAFRLRRRRPSSYVAIPAEVEVIEDVEKGHAHPHALGREDAGPWFVKPAPSNVAAVPLTD